jgi:hypothetical protein
MVAWFHLALYRITDDWMSCSHKSTLRLPLALQYSDLQIVTDSKVVPASAKVSVCKHASQTGCNDSLLQKLLEYLILVKLVKQLKMAPLSGRLMMEAASISETLVYFYQITRRNNQKIASSYSPP